MRRYSNGAEVWKTTKIKGVEYEIYLNDDGEFYCDLPDQAGRLKGKTWLQLYGQLLKRENNKRRIAAVAVTVWDGGRHSHSPALTDATLYGRHAQNNDHLVEYVEGDRKGERDRIHGYGSEVVLRRLHKPEKALLLKLEQQRKAAEEGLEKLLKEWKHKDGE